MKRTVLGLFLLASPALAQEPLRYEDTGIVLLRQVQACETVANARIKELQARITELEALKAKSPEAP